MKRFGLAFVLATQITAGWVVTLVSAASLDDLARWSAAHDQLASDLPEQASLETLAQVDRLQDALVDSLAAALATGGLPAERPPDDRVVQWVHRSILRGWVDAEPRFRAFVGRDFDLDRVQRWDPGGEWTLPAALALQAARRPEPALAWVERAPVPEAERPYAAALRLELLLARQDTLAAGVVANRLLLEGNWPEWAQQTMRRVVVRRALALRDAAAFQSAAREYRAHHGDDGWLAARTHEWLRRQGNLATADSLQWAWARREPEGPLARALLGNPRVRRDLATLPPHRLELLLEVAEAQSDLDRFVEFSSFPATGTTPAARGELAARGARLAVRARAYDLLFDRVRSGAWTGAGPSRPLFDLALARAYRNTGKVDSMHAAFERVVSHPQAGSGERRIAYWEWGRETESQRDFTRAAEIYGDMLRAGAGEKTYMAYYRMGLCRYHLEDLEGAIRAWTESHRHATRDWERAGAEFWLSKAHLKRGDIDAARAALARAADAGDGYYTQRARSELEFRRSEPVPDDADSGYWPRMCALGRESALTAVRPMRAPFSWSSTPARSDATQATGSDDSPGSRSLDRLAVLLRLFRQYGQSSWAALALDSLDAHAGLGDGAARLERLETLELPDLAARRAVRNEAELRYRYPTPYAAAVASAVADRDVAPEWVWSIMRRESFFEASVQSHAGAIGLMQFMPQTAREVGERFGLPDQPLRSPRVNLRLGAAHLAELIEETDGKWPILLAGYNAGMHNAVRWIHPDDDLDLFIEMIGYSETRDYVKAVLEAFWIYRELLRGGGAGDP